MSDHRHQTLAEMLALHELAPEDQAALLEESGQLIFEAALTRFLGEVDEPTAAALTDFVEVHQNEEAFLDMLFKEYPRFAAIYEEELAALQADIASEMREETDA